MIGRWCRRPRGAPVPPRARRKRRALHFHYAPGFATPTLAHMLDSLVRVSRRASWNHFASILDASAPPRDPPGRPATACCDGRQLHRAASASALPCQSPTRHLPRVYARPLGGPSSGNLPGGDLPHGEPMLTGVHNTRPRTAPATLRPPHWCQPLPLQQFQALFNSLFKVLFIFPSRYLFAIGLLPVFSFRWNLPPI